MRIITDQFTGRPRGFGFVEMATKEEATKAIEMLNGRLFRDRNLVVDEARRSRSAGRAASVERGDLGPAAVLGAAPRDGGGERLSGEREPGGPRPRDFFFGGCGSPDGRTRKAARQNSVSCAPGGASSAGGRSPSCSVNGRKRSQISHTFAW